MSVNPLDGWDTPDENGVQTFWEDLNTLSIMYTEERERERGLISKLIHNSFS